MQDNFTDLDLRGQAEPPQSPRGVAWLAWAVIIGVVALLVFNPMSSSEEEEEFKENQINLLLLKLQARVLVGTVDLLDAKDPAMARQARMLVAGSLDQRLRAVILVAELSGPAQALEDLLRVQTDMVKFKVKASRDQRRLLALLRQIFARQVFAPKKPLPLNAADQKFLKEELGWFGELALAPANGPDQDAREEVLESARRTVIALGALLLVFAVLALMGFVALIIFLVQMAGGKLQGGLGPPVPHGGVYAETFAVWLVLFILFSLLAASVPAGDSRLLVASCAMLMSLVALAWPVLRGIPWSQVRQDIGWTAGRQPFLEPFAGVGCYAMALPLVLVGLAIFAFLQGMQNNLGGGNGDNPFDAPSQPAHPIILFLSKADGWKLFQVFFLASIVAPIVEETMFRGVLYRHLRGATDGFGAAVSVLVCTFINCLIFAVIHPQGLLAAPLLMALAAGFTLAREWRGSLIASMVAHGTSNGLVMLLAVLALGG